MRPSVVVEVHGHGDCRDDLLDVPEDLVLEEFVLHRVVDPLRLGVVLRVSGLGHAYSDAAVHEQVDILAANILAATVRVMDKVLGRLQHEHLV